MNRFASLFAADRPESYWFDAIIESDNIVPFATLRKRAWASANSLLATKASDHSFRIV
jgi:hypothetical protein